MPTLAILALAALGVGLTTLIRLNNPWMIGALLAVGLAAGFNLVSGHIAFPLQAAGQFLIGISIGTRFQREALRRMPRVVAGSVLAVLALSAILFAVGAVLSLVGPIDLGTAVLSSSAGGIAEMTLTAQNLGLDAPLVAGFHFVRTVIVNGFAAHVWTRARRKS